MRACPSHPLLLLEVPHVSVRLKNVRATFVDNVAHTAACILWRHGYQDACFAAHSYGTFCASRICQLYRPIVHSLVSPPRGHIGKGHTLVMILFILAWRSSTSYPKAWRRCVALLPLSRCRPKVVRLCELGYFTLLLQVQPLRKRGHASLLLTGWMGGSFSYLLLPC
jgi:hypothetical protein